MPTIAITCELDLDCPAADVWAVLAAYDNDPAWRRGVVTMAADPSGPVRVGTTTAEELRFGGQTRRNLGEVVAVDPGRAFRWRTTEGADAEGGRSVEPLGPDRCRVRLELTVRPHGFDALLSPLLGPMLRRNVRGDLTRLRTLVGAPVQADA